MLLYLCMSACGRRAFCITVLKNAMKKGTKDLRCAMLGAYIGQVPLQQPGN